MEPVKDATKLTFVMPEAWGPAEDVEEFTGHDLTDKADLVETPFLILGIEIERNENRGYDVGYVYALDVNGTEFEFSDTSSTGVLVQLQAILVEQGLSPTSGDGFQKLKPKILVRKGLRVSTFDVVDEKTGKKRNASVYYLSGRSRPTA
jgi:hypothetical protein